MQNFNYLNSFGISQSAIKDFKFKSPKKWKSIWIDKVIKDKEEDFFTFGSLVDTLLFSPDQLNNRFLITNQNLPTQGLEKVIKNIYNQIYNNIDFEETLPPFSINLQDYKNEILKACLEEDWNRRWKSETLINKVIEDGSEYFKLLIESRNKRIISTYNYTEAINLVNVLYMSEYSKKYFINENDCENIFQLEIYSFHRHNDGILEVPIKGALDILHINRKNKTLQIVDFKTSYNSFDFIKSIKQYGYCDQLSFYIELLKKSLFDDEFLKKYNLDSDYKIINPINLVIDTDEKLPYIYEYSWDDLIISKEGNSKYLYNIYQSEYHPFKINLGWEYYLNQIAWHMELNKWDYPKEMYKNSKIKLNLINS